MQNKNSNIHLNDLIDRIDAVVGHHQVISERDVIKAISTIKKNKRNAVCFFGGDPEDIDTFKPINELLVLPYDVTWIEFKSELPIINNFGYFCTKNMDFIVAQIWIKPLSSKWNLLNEITFNKDSNGEVLITAEFRDNDDEVYINYLYSTLARFLSILNCTNIRKAEHKPSEKLQKARRIKGKLPIFSYWTLELKNETYDKSDSEHYSDRSSPRLHLRRGHPRQYSPGKYTYVQPCVVGNKELGMIHKDYEISNNI